MVVLGIDFGTSNTVAVLAGSGRAPRVLSVDGHSWMPSAVFVEDDGSLTVGRDAQRKARLAPERFEANPKRRIDDGEILLGVRVVAVVDAIAAVLRRVGEEARRQLNGRSPDVVNLTHPAQWGSARQNVLLAAARAAGLGGAIGLLPEPVGAAAHFASLPGQSLPPGAALAVYDLGGGTFDCAVVGSSGSGFSVLAEAGLPDVGGVDFDQTVLDHLGRSAGVVDPGRWQSLTRPRSASDRRAARSLREDVRAAKETLSRYSQADVPLPEPFEDSLLTRREFEGLIRPSVVRTVELLAATIERAGWSPERLAGIYLVGGSSRIPLVAGVISEKLGVVASTLDQPETSVAMGAAISPGALRPAGRTQTLGPASGPRPPVPGPRPPVVSPPPVIPAPPASTTGTQGPSVTGTQRPSVSGPHGPSVSGPHGPSATAPPARTTAPHASSVTGPHGPSVSGPHGPSVSGPHGPSVTGVPVASVSGPHPASSTGPHPPPGPGHGRKRLLLWGSVAAAVIIAVVVTIIVTTHGSNTAGGDTTTSTTSSGTGSTSALQNSASTSVDAPKQPVVPTTCQDAPIDNSGMTPCLLSLAGPNANRALGCSPAPVADQQLKEAMGDAKTVAASGCIGLNGGQVTVFYVQFDSADEAITAIDSMAGKLNLKEKSWSQGGASGRYVSSDKPAVYWSYSGLPVIGFAVADTDDVPSGEQSLTQGQMTAFLKESLLPQAPS